MSLKPIILREQIIKSIRDFFYDRKFHEVVIPVFNTSLPLEQNIYPFQTTWDNLKGKKDFYLTTSPEAYLKKMIAKGMGNCFAIGHSFRNMESAGILHNPEFLMLEWYREDANYRMIMKETKELILFVKKRVGSKVDLKDEWKILSLEQLFAKYAGLKLTDIIDDQTMSKAAIKKGYKVENNNWEQLFNQIFLNEIEVHLAAGPLFLVDYPAKISPLCAKRKDKPYLAQRFELYINGIEIGNGNTENSDAKEVLKDFNKEAKNRIKLGIVSPPMDMEFILAIRKMKGKKFAGIGMGIDRLTMIIAGVNDIQTLQGPPLRG